MDPGSLILFAVTILFAVFLFSGQRRRQQAFASLQSQLAPGLEIVTTSGLFARIVEIDESVAVLETGPGQQVRWDRRAIASVVPDPSTDTGPTPAES